MEFSQAVRILLRAHSARGGSEGAGRGAAVRFVPSASLAYPVAEIESLEPGGEDKPPRMSVTSPGLAGAQGVLPLWYTEFLRERLGRRDHAMLDFMTLVQQPFLWLHYQ